MMRGRANESGKSCGPAAPQALMDALGHRFERPSLLQEALTHPSLSAFGQRKKHGTSPYERLEFLGDRVLGLVIADALLALYPEVSEGELAKRHAALVNRDALREVALALDLARYLRLAPGEVSTDAHKNLAALPDATEAVIAALYLDGGLGAARAFVLRAWDSVLKTGDAPEDPKTTLQEWAQGQGHALPVYREVAKTGPAHAPEFEIEVRVQGFPAFSAKGASKRLAEKMAASGLLELINEGKKK